MSVHIFGIRHHGPGCAKHLHQALQLLQPDAILIEGPAEAEPLLPLVLSEQMVPPVALLFYAPDRPSLAGFYPFTCFSPEWIAMRFALANGKPIHMIDLPKTNDLAFDLQVLETSPITADNSPPSTDVVERKVIETEAEPFLFSESIANDPLQYMATLSGFEDGELWWEYYFEERQNGEGVFESITELMTTLRSELNMPESERDLLREAYMRKSIRSAQSKYEKVAVICGAWHVPALTDMPSAKSDNDLLKNMPKVKVECTWVPWSYDRLTFTSGYRAGINAPSWYDHVWKYDDELTVRWITRAAELFRKNGLDISIGHTIEATRLAQALAIIRGRFIAGLDDMMDAIQSVFCYGNPELLHFIRDQLIIGDTIGRVPDDTPRVPLLRDFHQKIKQLRLVLSATETQVKLDLRQENGVLKSQLFHQLLLMNVPCVQKQHYTGGKGSFHEHWVFHWQPEHELRLIELSRYGNTLPESASAYVIEKAFQATHLAQITPFLEPILQANLANALSVLMDKLLELASLTSDVNEMIDLLPKTIETYCYGNVRKTDQNMIYHVIDTLLIRVNIGLANACYGLDDDAAMGMLTGIVNLHQAVHLLNIPEHTESWHKTLLVMSNSEALHGLITGRIMRILYDQRIWDFEQMQASMEYVLSKGSTCMYAAQWLEGFLKGSGVILLHQSELLNLLRNWVVLLSVERFTELLPLLRRTFSEFDAPLRRNIGELIAQGTGNQPSTKIELNMDRATRPLALINTLLLGQ